METLSGRSNRSGCLQCKRLPSVDDVVRIRSATTGGFVEGVVTSLLGNPVEYFVVKYELPGIGSCGKKVHKFSSTWTMEQNTCISPRASQVSAPMECDFLEKFASSVGTGDGLSQEEIQKLCKCCECDNIQNIGEAAERLAEKLGGFEEVLEKLQTELGEATWAKVLKEWEKHRDDCTQPAEDVNKSGSRGRSCSHRRDSLPLSGSPRSLSPGVPKDEQSVIELTYSPRVNLPITPRARPSRIIQQADSPSFNRRSTSPPPQNTSVADSPQRRSDNASMGRRSNTPSAAELRALRVARFEKP